MHGIKRCASSFNTDRIDHLYQVPHEPDVRMTLHYGDMTNTTNLIHIIQEVRIWWSSPFTNLLGSGADVFSGISGPFQTREAHNSLIDILAMGGVVGLIVIYFCPMRIALLLFGYEMRVTFSLFTGILVFSFIHLVPRHPIFWFTVLAVAWMMDARRRDVAL